MNTKKPSKIPAKTDDMAKKAHPQSPLTRSNTEAEQEIAKLRGNREQLESEPPQGGNDARASLI
jgi:hypothetical protein